MKDSETEIKRKIRRFLKTIPCSKWVSYSPYPYGEPGTPDIVGAIEGFMIMFEVKAPGGHLSAIQKLRRSEWLDAGVSIFTVRSVQEVKSCIKQVLYTIKLIKGD